MTTAIYHMSTQQFWLSPHSKPPNNLGAWNSKLSHSFVDWLHSPGKLVIWISCYYSQVSGAQLSEGSTGLDIPRYLIHMARIWYWLLAGSPAGYCLSEIPSRGSCSFCFSQHGAWVPGGCIPTASIPKGTSDRNCQASERLLPELVHHQFHYILLVKTVTDSRGYRRKFYFSGSQYRRYREWNILFQSSLENTVCQREH